MKLLVFAHTPPPHHGQSYMVKLLLDGLGGDARQTPQADPGSPITCYHVNCRYSEDLEDIGSFRIEKMWLVLRYCLEAVWCRFRHGVRAFYYVPAPGKRAALYRDWTVMILCRPFFRDFIHHWHAVGLGDWLQREGTWLERRLTHWLLGRPALGLALAIPSMRDALWFRTRRVELVANGIPDPCPDFQPALLPRRRARHAARLRWFAGDPSADPAARIFRVLFLAHCTRDKGLFDALEGVVLANARAREGRSPMRFQLTIAGLFPREDEAEEFRAIVSRPDIAEAVSYVGFVEGARKAALLRESDCLCFPTYYSAEGQPVNLLEAMGCGLSIVTTRWRTIPELLSEELATFVAPRAPAEIAAALEVQLTRDRAEALRAHFLARGTEERHLAALAAALKTLEA